MKIKIILSLIFLSAFFIQCKKENNIEGLWGVTSVKVGDNEMTPNGRWTRFNSDFTQESGNGWLQHSVGTYQLNSVNNTLIIKNSNGIDDNSSPFTISIEKDIMYWSRMEEGQQVNITLKRIDKLPQTYGDKLFGLWELEKSIGNGSFFKAADSLGILFLRWDRRVEIGTANGKTYGVYNVHGHKPEIEIIPYGEIGRSFWNIDFEAESITLTLLNAEEEVKRTFKRIRQFPE